MSMERTHRNTWIGLGVAVLLVLVGVSALSGGMWGHEVVPGGYYGRQFAGGPWLWGIGLFGLFIRLAVWGALIALVVSLFRRRSYGRFDAAVDRSDPSSVEILKRRYAAGEITREQFEEMRQVVT
jgi:putative membrane protein